MIFPRPIRFAPFTALLIETERFRQAGGLNEELGTYMEDVEFGLRCSLAGWTSVYEPTAVATHRGSATDGAWSAEMVRRISRNQVALVALRWPRPLGPEFVWNILVGQGLWGLLALRRGRFLAWLRGKREGLALWRGLRSRVRLAAAGEVSAMLRESEAELRKISIGSYWRAYKWLTPFRKG